MNEMELLDKHAGKLAVLEGAIALLVTHLANAGAIDKAAYIRDLRAVADQPQNEQPLHRAGHHLADLVEMLS